MSKNVKEAKLVVKMDEGDMVEMMALVKACAGYLSHMMDVQEEILDEIEEIRELIVCFPCMEDYDLGEEDEDIEEEEYPGEGARIKVIKGILDAFDNMVRNQTPAAMYGFPREGAVKNVVPVETTAGNRSPKEGVVKPGLMREGTAKNGPRDLVKKMSAEEEEALKAFLFKDDSPKATS